MQGQAPPGQDQEKNRPETNPWPSDNQGKPTESEVKDAVDKLEKYFEDILTWGRLVRDDIKKLEAQAGLPKGDPGDPPAGPW